MEFNGRTVALTVVVFLVLLGLVLAIAAMTIRPANIDLLNFGLLLLATGAVTLAFSVIVSRTGLPGWVRSFRGQLLVVTGVTVLLVLVTIGIVSYLMFLSTHDAWLLVGLLVFAAGLSVIAALYLSRPATRNIHRVIMAVREIGEGDLEVRVPAEATDEIGELARAFNTMAARIKESLEREQTLMTNRRELVESVSHDLRTPLSSLRVVIESLNDGVVTDEADVKRYLQTAQSEVMYLGQLVDDLFELSRIDAGLMTLHTEPVYLDELVADTVEAMTPQAARQGLALGGEVAEGMGPVSADAVRLQRVLHNLVQNALMHTPAGGAVTIMARDRDGGVEVTVTDTGEGIAEEELARIFERNHRPTGEDRRARGSGLGLSIARGIVEAHGGSIRAASRPDDGSTFTFTLPR